MTNWRNDLVCGIDRLEYDFETRVARLYLPDCHCADMTGAIKLAETIDDHVKVIITYAGDKPDTRYNLTTEGWVAGCLRQR